ncbi:DUF4383 domain-containing protein [Kineococcus aurantiacus]|uniref:DUF4383 domain-containing protein n=1 Tax=Kineococcus aurantiacus TaxID=37633 RepID=A0A7Y9AUH9_9ACTN|nr:DUF4383 domain-containing protein [Kineococcus aurantiacus]NYD21726.1 hypothetical protein [Kineococcus aurantiacus]
MSQNFAGSVEPVHPRTTAGQHLSLVVGVLLLLLGVAGFAVSGVGDWTGGTQEQQVVGFSVNPLSSAVHVVLGLLGLLGRTGARRGRWFGIVLFAACAALFAWGLSSEGSGDTPLNLAWPVTTLHGVLAAAGLLIALVPVRAGRRPSTAELG